MSYIVSYTGKIEFDPKEKTKKHEGQASWKKIAMVVFDSELDEYYSWFLNKRFGLTFNKIHRDPHITFINDSINDISNNGLRTEGEVNALWEKVKKKWDGKYIGIVLNLRPFSNNTHWWLIVDHKYREELHAIRAELGLPKPYFGLHMTIGMTHPNQLEFSEYLNTLNENGFIEMNKDYGVEI